MTKHLQSLQIEESVGDERVAISWGILAAATIALGLVPQYYNIWKMKAGK